MVDRALIVLNTEAARKYAIAYIRHTPDNTRVEFRGPKRSREQNDRLWAMLSDVARQKEHCGRKYDTDQWKVLFMHACGQADVTFLPSLDNKTWLPYGDRSSKLSVAQMSELLECISAWGAQNGVIFNDPRNPPNEAA